MIQIFLLAPGAAPVTPTFTVSGFNGSCTPTPNDIFAAQVTFIVPYAASQNPVATIQVINGSTLSNIVTAFVYKTTPEVLTFNPVGGIGFAARA